MSISLNRVQTAKMSPSLSSGIVPAAAVWEPKEGVPHLSSGVGVRRLSRQNRTGELIPGEQVSKNRDKLPKVLQLGEAAQAYLAGVAFGLLLVLGLLLGASLEEPMPTSTLPISERSVSLG
ncbi:hypothetical protein COCCU_08430 [Corynebacterium occultum]|uniref:Uncharacterized protein n=1 Tax=Corynebacterium occultum TaxID=2675219 RepID=A0A6B8WC62_9CORY|nr:hypothetical protein [Corynebacterium occultum]QGU07610.1 hypothetical protein COCCU_08430 [Corynebacterium occultum]